MGSHPPSNDAEALGRALLVGINYVGTSGELAGCVNDVRKVESFLRSHGWASVLMLTDDAQQKTDRMPTKANIIAAMRWLAEGSAPGDVLFFHFSGHGGQQVDVHGDEEDGMDETICPLDFSTAGQISDDDLFELLVSPLPAGVRLTCLLDCCHSGHGMDFPFTLYQDGYGGVAWNADPRVRQDAVADVLLFSGCDDDECSADATCRYGLPAGAMTSAFLDAMAELTVPQQAGQQVSSTFLAPASAETQLAAGQLQHDCMHRVTYPGLLERLQLGLAARGFGQSPQVSSTQPFRLDRSVRLDDVLQISGTSPLGPIVHVPRPPNLRRAYEGGFGEMLCASEASGYLALALAASHGAHMPLAGGGGGIFQSIFGGGVPTIRPFGGAREACVGEPAPAFAEASHHQGVLSVDGSFSNEEYDEDEDEDDDDAEEDDAFGDFYDDDYD